MCYDSRVAFARWDPIRDLLALQQRLDRFAPGPAAWIPAMDLLETPDQYIITAEVPGVARQDLDVQVRDDHVTISGMRQPRSLPCEQYHRIERGHGGFSRTFQLPAPVDAERLVADLRDGVLIVTCQKADARARRIQVT